MMYEFIRNLANLIVHDKYETILIELTPVNTLNVNSYEFEGLNFKVFSNTNLITAQDFKFGSDYLHINNLEFMDDLFANSGPNMFSRNHIIISTNHINANKITKEICEKIQNIGARYYAIYYLSDTNIEEVDYGQFVKVNSN